MAEVLELSGLDDPAAGRSCEVLEAGGLVRFSHLPFTLREEEEELLDPKVLDPKSKNVSYDARTGRVGGAAPGAERAARLGGLLDRFARRADEIALTLAPAYAGALDKRRTSFRPGAIETRALSPRKDDKRLHVDAFPSTPVQGRRIFRVFANVNPSGIARRWRVGETEFGAFAAQFRGRLSPRPGGAWRQALGLTRGPRTAYDHAMLQLHDAAKMDESFQKTTPALDLEFPAGSMWVVYTDSVLHAAMSGQHALEQTYLLPVASMREPSRSPLRRLEALLGRPLT